MEGIGGISEKIVVSEERAVSQAVKKTNGTEKAPQQEKQEPDMPKDEYISSEKSGQKPTGLYSVEKKDGNTVIRYDDPRKAGDGAGADSSVVKLKSTRDSLKIQLKQMDGNSPRARQMKKRLKEIEKQIKQAGQ